MISISNAFMLILMTNHIQYKERIYDRMDYQISCIFVLSINYNRILTNIAYRLNT